MKGKLKLRLAMSVALAAAGLSACSMTPQKSSGGAGLLYCFAVN